MMTDLQMVVFNFSLVLRWMAMVVSIFMLIYISCECHGTEKARKWYLVVALLHAFFLGTGLYNQTPYMVSQVFLLGLLWLIFTSTRIPGFVNGILLILMSGALLVTGWLGMQRQEANIVETETIVSEETRILSNTEELIRSEGEKYSFFVRNEDGTLSAVDVPKDNVTINTLSEGEESYVVERTILHERVNYNGPGPRLEESKEYQVYIFYLDSDSVAIV